MPAVMALQAGGAGMLGEAFTGINAKAIEALNALPAADRIVAVSKLAPAARAAANYALLPKAVRGAIETPAMLTGYNTAGALGQHLQHFYTGGPDTGPSVAQFLQQEGTQDPALALVGALTHSPGLAAALEKVPSALAPLARAGVGAAGGGATDIALQGKYNPSSFWPMAATGAVGSIEPAPPADPVNARFNSTNEISHDNGKPVRNTIFMPDTLAARNYAARRAGTPAPAAAADSEAFAVGDRVTVKGRAATVTKVIDAEHMQVRYDATGQKGSPLTRYVQKEVPNAQETTQAQSARRGAAPLDETPGENAGVAAGHGGDVPEYRSPGEISRGTQAAQETPGAADAVDTRATWQMTPDEFIQDRRQAGVLFDDAHLRQAHRDEVIRALAEGKAVPDAVMAHYQDLQTKGATNATETGQQQTNNQPQYRGDGQQLQGHGAAGELPTTQQEESGGAGRSSSVPEGGEKPVGGKAFPTTAQQYVRSSTGDYVYGTVRPEEVGTSSLPAAPIYLTQSGSDHIWDRHEDELELPRIFRRFKLCRVHD